MYGIFPQGKAHAHMIGKLGHEKGLAYLGSAHKEVSPCVEQTVYNRRSALVHILIEVLHGDCRQIGGVVVLPHLPQHFLQIFLRGVVFGKILWYTLSGYL